MRKKDKERLPSTRAEGKKLKTEFYYTGNECKHGHTTIRRVADGMCVDCRKRNAQIAYQERRDYYLTYFAKYRAENREYWQEYREDNGARMFVHNKKYFWGKDNLAEDWDENHERALEAMKLRADELGKETGFMHYIRRIDKKQPAGMDNWEIVKTKRKYTRED